MLRRDRKLSREQKLDLRRFLSLSIYMPFRSAVDEDDDYRVRLRGKIDHIQRQLAKNEKPAGAAWAAPMLAALEYMDDVERELYRCQRISKERERQLTSVIELLAMMDKEYGPFTDASARYLIDPDPMGN